MAVDLAAYTQAVATGAGVLFVSIVIGYAVMTRNAGREGDELSHERAVNKALDDLSTSKQTVASEPDLGFINDIEYLASRRRPAGRVKRLRQWFRRRLPRGLVAHGWVIEDADGRNIHVASVNGRRLAHRDVDALVEDAQTVVSALANHETPPATMSEKYYTDIIDGFVDIEDTRARVRGDCQTRIEANMRRNEELDHEELFDRLVYDRGFRYPPEIVATKLDELEGRVIRQRKDGSVTYQHFN